MFQNSEVGIISLPIEVYQIMAEPSHLLHDDAALGKNHILFTVGIDDLLRMVDAEIIQRTNNLVHGCSA